MAFPFPIISIRKLIMKKSLLSILRYLLIFAFASSEECGVRNIDVTGLDHGESITNETQYGEFPWMVFISEDRFFSNKLKLAIYKCGGSIIHPQVVLTSAKCVMSRYGQYKIRAGDCQVRSQDELSSKQNRIVNSIVTHPEYDAKTSNNDIALLILDKPLNMTVKNVGSICLPHQNKIFEENTECYVTSWGPFTPEEFHSILQKYNLPVIKRHDCEQRLKKTHLGNQYTLHESFICSESNNYYAVGEGDPFVCSIPGKPGIYYQIGLTSWDVDVEPWVLGRQAIEDNTNTPIIYTNVGKFRQWIDNEIQKLSFNISSF